MELINKYKFRCIYDTIIKDRLLSIFYDRWLIESGEPWKNNVAFGSFIRNQLPLVYNKIDTDNQKYIDNGQIYKLDYSSLVEILINTKEIKQNQIIQNLNEYYIKFVKNQCLLGNKIYNKSIKGIIELITKLDQSNSIYVDIETEINNRINDVEESINNNGEFINEEKAIELNKKGLKEFNENNYEKAMVDFDTALDFQNISYGIKFELFYNISNSYFELIINSLDIKHHNNYISMNKTHHGKYQDLILIEYSKQFMSKAIIIKPSFANAYFKLGVIYSKFGEYQQAMKYFQCSNILDKNLKTEVEKWMNELFIKYVSISNSINSNGGDRNYEKESKLKIENYKSLDKFKNQNNNNNNNNNNFTKSFIKSNLPRNYKNKMDEVNKLSESIGVSSNILYEKLIILNALSMDLNESKSKIQTKICKTLIRNNTEWADPYILLALLKMNSVNTQSSDTVESNHKLIVSLFLKASLVPLFHQHYKSPNCKVTNEIIYMYTHNFNISVANYQLGKIYRFGLFGEDYDFKKAQYYFKLCADYTKKTYEQFGDEKLKLNNLNCFYFLGQLYNFDYFNKSEIDSEKARYYWKIGSEFGDNDCTVLLNKYFNETIPLVDLFQQKSNLIKFKEFHNEMTTNAIKSVGPSVSLYELPIDFNLYKTISEDKEHPSNQYAKSIYSNHLKVLKFIKLFKSLKKNKLKEKFELIKILASALRDYDNYFLIRIPIEIKQNIDQLLQQLLKSSPSNIDVRICWLGLNCFSIPPNTEDVSIILKFINESIGYSKNEEDYSIFKYYEIIKNGFSGEVNNQFNNLISLFKPKQQQQPFTILNSSNKDIFTYLLLSIINEIEPSIITQDHLNLIISNVDSYNTRSIKGNPQNAEINFKLYLLLKSKNNDNSIIKKYYDIGVFEKNNIIISSSLKQFNIKMGDLLDSIN